MKFISTLLFAITINGSLSAQNHPWLSLPNNLLTPSVYFTNLSDGDKLESPVTVKVGLKLWGIAPAGTDLADTGHHHILINTKLPAMATTPIPFSKQHVHLGKGQQEIKLDLAPGEHTLRLLLADHEHVPKDGIYSKQIKVTVTGLKQTPSPAQDTVSLLQPVEGAIVKPPFLMQFHASGNVLIGHQKTPGAKETGYFILTLTPEGKKPERIEFIGGQTEAYFAPPPGKYSAVLQHSKALLNNAPLRSERINFTVR